MGIERSFYIQKTEGECWRELNGLYNVLTGKTRSRDEYAWEWLSNPMVPSSMWVIREKSTDRVVGHHGLIPICFNVHGREILAGKTENTMIHPDYRKKVFYPAFERQAFGRARKKYDLLFTTAGKGAPGAVRRRLGYELVGNWYIYLLKVNLRVTRLSLFNSKKTIFHKWTFARMLLLYAFRLYAGGRGLLRTPPKDYKLIEIKNLNTFANQAAEFWHENRRYFGITPDRNKKYLEWRIKNNPYISYRAFELRDERGVCGFAILKNSPVTLGGETVISTFIEDIVVRRNDKKTYINCINKLINEFKTSDRIACKTVYIENDLNRALKACQMFPWRSARRVSKKNYSPCYAFYNTNISDEDWFITQLMTEGV